MGSAGRNNRQKFEHIRLKLTCNSYNMGTSALPDSMPEAH